MKSGKLRIEGVHFEIDKKRPQQEVVDEIIEFFCKNEKHFPRHEPEPKEYFVD